MVEPTRARRVAESARSLPDFTVTVEAGVIAAAQDALTQLAARLDPAPDLDDLVVKACGLAGEFPRVNGSYRDGHFELYSRVNVGIAVHGDGALTAPTIFDADTKPLADLRGVAPERASAQRRHHAAAAGADVHGVVRSACGATTAIHPAPGRGAVGAEVSGTIELALSCDHRTLLRRRGRALPRRVRELLERPVGLVV